MQIIVDNIFFERINLVIEGIVPACLTELSRLYLEHQESGKQIDIFHHQVQDGRFHGEIDLYAADRNHPVTSGNWCVKATANNQEVITFVMVDEPRVDELSLYLSDKGRNHFFVDAFRTRDTLQFHVDNAITPFAHPRTLKRHGYLAVFRLFHWFKRFNRKEKVLFTSASRKAMGGNLEFVYNQLLEDGYQGTIATSFKENIWARASFKDKFLLPYHIATADYIFIEDFQPMVNVLPIEEYDDIILSQLWHANGAFKTFGYSRLGKPAAPRLNGRNHKIYDYSFVSSRHVARYYAEAFAITEDKVIPTGIPKTDMFFSETYRKETRERMMMDYPFLQKADNIILYGPTFRGGGPKTAYFPYHKLDFEALANYCRRTNSLFLIKSHFLVRNQLVIPEAYQDVIVDMSGHREINDLLFVADLLITDYSSTVYEASTLDLPMLFYAFDKQEYISSRGFYEPYDTFTPGRIVETMPELMEALENKDYQHEKVRLFKEKNFDYEDGKSAERILAHTVYQKREGGKS